MQKTFKDVASLVAYLERSIPDDAKRSRTYQVHRIGLQGMDEIPEQLQDPKIFRCFQGFLKSCATDPPEMLRRFNPEDYNSMVRYAGGGSTGDPFRNVASLEQGRHRAEKRREYLSKKAERRK